MAFEDSFRKEEQLLKLPESVRFDQPIKKELFGTAQVNEIVIAPARQIRGRLVSVAINPAKRTSSLVIYQGGLPAGSQSTDLQGNLLIYSASTRSNFPKGMIGSPHFSLNGRYIKFFFGNTFSRQSLSAGR